MLELFKMAIQWDTANNHPISHLDLLIDDEQLFECVIEFPNARGLTFSNASMIDPSFREHSKGMRYNIESKIFLLSIYICIVHFQYWALNRFSNNTRHSWPAPFFSVEMWSHRIKARIVFKAAINLIKCGPQAPFCSHPVNLCFIASDSFRSSEQNDRARHRVQFCRVLKLLRSGIANTCVRKNSDVLPRWFVASAARTVPAFAEFWCLPPSLTLFQFFIFSDVRCFCATTCAL